MTTLILEVYDAFKSVGIDDDAARKAAGALSNVQSETGSLRAEMNERFAESRAEMNERFNQIDRKFDALILSMEKRFGKSESDLLLVKWMFGILVAGVASTVLRLYF